MRNLILCSFLLLFVSFTYSQESIKVKEIGLEVMKRDIGEMNITDTKEFFADLGDGWRLPTIDELKNMFEYRGRIGRFKDDWYLSSTENQYWMWTLSFEVGDVDNLRTSGYVRAVRDLK